MRASPVKNPISFLRVVALAEGVSFLVLLGVAMPLRKFAGMPAAVTWTGWVHGILFMIFGLALLRAMRAGAWPIGRAAVVFIAALVPFGPFVLDRRMREYEAELSKRLETATVGP
jgi:integral membrane protein